MSHLAQAYRASSTAELMQRIAAAPPGAPSASLPVGESVPLVAKGSYYVLPPKPTAETQQQQPPEPAKPVNNLKLLFALGNSSLIVNAKYYDLKQITAGQNSYVALIRVKQQSEDSIEITSQPDTVLLIGVDSQQKIYRVDLSEVVSFEVDQFEIKVMRMIDEVMPT